MIAKKNRKADLERKRFAFFQIGLLASGSLCLAAFEYTSADAEEQFVEVKTEEPILIGPEQVYDFAEQPKEQPKVRAIQEVVDEVEIVDKMVNDQGVIAKAGEDVNFDEKDEPGYGNFTIVDFEEPIIDIPSVDPEFIGGEVAMQRWIIDHIKYPEICAEMRLGGTAYVQFVVNTDGSICMVQEVSSEKTDLHAELKKEAERVVRLMPKWKPGENAGKKVRVRYTIPIRFLAP